MEDRRPPDNSGMSIHDLNLADRFKMLHAHLKEEMKENRELKRKYAEALSKIESMELDLRAEIRKSRESYTVRIKDVLVEFSKGLPAEKAVELNAILSKIRLFWHRG